LVHTQNDENTVIGVHRSKVHIFEDQDLLEIYVPKDRKEQELCFLQFLPTKLFNEVIMDQKSSNSTLSSDSEAVRIIAALLASSDDVVCDFLDDAGIIPVPYLDEFDHEAFEATTGQQEDYLRPDRETASNSSPRRHRGQSPAATSSTGSRFLSTSPPSSYKTNYRISTPTFRRPSIFSFTSRPSTPQTQNSDFAPLSINSGRAEYRRLLNNVIDAAKSKRGGFPSRGAFNLDELSSALPLEPDPEPVSYSLPFGVRSENQLAHDMKVGAAGELYVRFATRFSCILAHSFAGV
jgi:hypothetical protein